MHKRLISLLSSCEPLSFSVAQAADTSRPSPPHSVLSRTLPHAWQLSEEESDALWQAFDSLPLGLLVPPSHEGAGWCAPLLAPEDDIELVLASSTQYLLHEVSSPDAFDALVDSLRTEVGLTIGRDVNDATAASKDPIIGSIASPLLDLPVRAVEPRQSLAQFCEDEGIVSLALLQNLSEADILSVWGLRADALLAIEDCYAMSGLMGRLRRYESDPPEDPDIEAMVRRALERGIQAPDRARRATEVHLYRLGLLTGKMESHRAIGAMMGVTGARTDQIEKRSLRGFNSSAFLDELAPLRVAVLAYFLANCGAVRPHDLAEGIAPLTHLDEAPSEVVARTLIEILPECEMSTLPDLAVLADHPCLECTAIDRVVNEIDNRDKPVSLEVTTGLVARSCPTAGNCRCPFQAVSVLAVAATVATRRQGPVLRGKWLVPGGVGGFRPDALVHLAEEVLRREARPMHFAEVHRLLVEETGRSDSARNIHACLDRSPRSVLWDRGTYIHKDHMPFPYSLVRQAEDWIRRGLSGVDGLPMMSVHGVYEHHRTACEAEAVPSESALYSLLRQSADAELVFPRYPRIVSSREYTGPVPLSLFIGEYVRAAGQPVPLKELRALVVGRMGFKEFQLSQALNVGIPGTLRTKHWALVHEDYVDFDADVLDKCIALAARLLENGSNVSVKRVFSDLRVDCQLGGVDSPELLFSLMRLSSADAVETGHYPLLVHPRAGAPTRISVLESIEEYVQNKRGPCSYQELEEEFVENRKYSAPTVYQIVRRHHILRYLPSSVIHEDSLGLSSSDFEVVSRRATERFAADLEAGRLFSTVRSLLEEEEALPVIVGDVVWTEQLLASVLERSGGFLLVGNAKNAFVTRPNCLGIDSFGDLVSAIVRRDYGGGVGQVILESRLREEGVILKQLTASMLDGHSSVVMRGMEVVVAEVAHA